jgi:hypothetical protein
MSVFGLLSFALPLLTDDPFTLVEFYIFRVTLLIVFMVALYRILVSHVKR